MEDVNVFECVTCGWIGTFDEIESIEFFYRCPECGALFFFGDENDDSFNNGGDTGYYKFKSEWGECQDIIEDRGMNFAQGNILKVAFCFNTGRHVASTYERDLNKIKWFADRELERIRWQ